MTSKRLIEEFTLNTVNEMRPLIDQLNEVNSNQTLINRILNNTSGANLQKLTVALAYLMKHEPDANTKATLKNLHQSVETMHQTFLSTLDASRKVVEENQKQSGQKPSPADKQKANDYAAYLIIYKEPKCGENGNLDKLIAGLNESKERYDTLISEIKRRNPDDKVSSAIITKLENEVRDYSMRNNKDPDHIATLPKPSG